MADDVTPPEEAGDQLPEDLDVTAYVGPYLFPTMERRRIPAIMYLALAALCVLGYLASRNGGLLAAAIVLALIDAVDGSVMGEYTEPNPEDWSKYGLEDAAPAS